MSNVGYFYKKAQSKQSPVFENEPKLVALLKGDFMKKSWRQIISSSPCSGRNAFMSHSFVIAN
jgi:hypothetical protein